MVALRAAIEPWHRRLVDALAGEKLPTRVVATVTLSFADRRKRNVANWEPAIRRLVVDAVDRPVVELMVKLGRRRKRAVMTIMFEEAR